MDDQTRGDPNAAGDGDRWHKKNTAAAAVKKKFSLFTFYDSFYLLPLSSSSVNSVLSDERSGQESS